MENAHEILTTGTVTENRKLGSGYFELIFRLPAGMTVPEPGQFLTIRCGDGPAAPLLRRPFAWASREGDTASVIAEIRGQGTLWMSRLKPGDALDILGPLGRGFRFPPGGILYLAAGGIGLGPMLHTRTVLRAAGRKLFFVAGFRDQSRIISALPEAEDVLLCTDDGSRGFHGTVTSRLEELIAEKGPGTLLACGPHPMLRACRDLARKCGIGCQVSLEEVMACGVGACAGCVVPGREPGTYLRVCKDGPVFDSEELAWT